MSRETWTDSRLDDLNHKVDRIDRRIDARFDAMESRMDARFDAIHARFDTLQRVMIQAAVGGIVALITAGAAIVATQL